MNEKQIDVLVIGGGPAGSTAAAILAKYNPDLDIVLVEQATFPRHHIGESLVIEVNRILKDMDAFDDVAGAGFLKKGGATFVWGQDRAPWSLRFHEGHRIRTGSGDVGAHTWHVERGRYDAILLEAARRHGVTVVQPAKAELDELGDDFVRATVTGENGEKQAVRARFCIDAGGRNATLARRVGKRNWDPVLRNVALYGYWRGAELDPQYSGTWDLSLINVISIPSGWIWYIPVAEGIVSVGVVTSHDHFKQHGAASREKLYAEMLATSPEVSAWLRTAERCSVGGSGTGVLIENDFNYTHSTVSGSSWALVGDAAGFVDPLFSIGVFLSQTAGQLLAYTVGTALAGEIPAPRLFEAYDQHMRGYLGAFRSMAYVFYGFNAPKEEWWQKTRELVRAQALPTNIDDREAFIALTFGFGVNVTLFHEAIACFGQLAAPRIREALLGKQEEPALAISRGARPKLIRAYATSPSAVPAEGTGRMIPMTRVELAAVTDATAEHSAFPRHFYLPDALVPLLEHIDGSRTVTELLALARTMAPVGGNNDPDLFGRHVLRALAGFGALERTGPR